MDNFDLRKYISEGRIFKEELSYAFSEYDFTIEDDAYQDEVEVKIKKELKKVQSEPLEIPEKDLQAIIKNAENYFSKEARKEEKANRNPRKIKSTEFAQFAADYYTEEYYPENYGKDYPDKRPVNKPVSDDQERLKSFDGIDVPSTPEEREIRRRSKLRLKYGHAAYFIRNKDLPKDLFYSMPKDEFDKTFGRIVDEPTQDELIDGNIDILFDKPVNEVRQFFDDKQLANDILRNQADVERQLGTKLKDFKFSGDDRVFTAVDPEEFTVYAFKYRDVRDPKFPYKDEEPFLSDEGYEPQIIKVDGKKVAVTVGNI